MASHVALENLFVAIKDTLGNLIDNTTVARTSAISPQSNPCCDCAGRVRGIRCYHHLQYTVIMDVRQRILAGEDISLNFHARGEFYDEIHAIGM